MNEYMDDNELLSNGYITNTFMETFPDVNTFLTEYKDSGITPTITEESATTLYFLLYSKFGNSHFANFDLCQAKYKIWATIFQYGPTWEKEIDIQKNIRNLSLDELQTASQNIQNHAFNPSTELPESGIVNEVNDQVRTSHKRGKIEAYALIISLLKKDVTEEFLSKFKKIFIRVAAHAPICYDNYIGG